MKKLLPAIAISAILFSCNQGNDKGKFTINGELRSAADQNVYLEELFFSQKQPEVLDTGMLKKGKFTVSAIGSEEGLYRVRTADGKSLYFFINDASNIIFSADANATQATSQSFNTAANNSLKKLLQHADSVENLIGAKSRIIVELKKSGTADTDSVYMSLTKEFDILKETLAGYCFAFADSSKSPIVSLFAVNLAPASTDKLEIHLAALAKRFPNHNGIAGAVSYLKDQIAQQGQDQLKPPPQVFVGSMAPEITMNDVDDKPFSLSQLRGKYVLVDFWASWCGPCREENPNVLAAYNQFKDKNFTVLGVSLDDNKAAWLKAIAADNLAWQQISDLKKWSSAVVGPYGIEGIPYNVLVDPQGKIIATSLRGGELLSKLGEVLK